MDLETLQGYACWVIASALAATALYVILASVVHWLS
jgi:hypothetical protein